GECLREGLAAKRGHVRNGIETVGDLFAAHHAPHISHFDCDFRAESSLDGEIELVCGGGLQIGIDHPAYASRRISVDAGKERLRKNLRNAWQGRRKTIGSDAERGGGIHARGSQTLAGDTCSDTRYGLADAGSLQGDLYQIDAVHTGPDAAVSAAEDGLAGAEQFAQDAAVEFRIPCGSQARAETAVEGVVRILATGTDVTNRRKAEDWIIDLPVQRRQLLLGEIVFGGNRLIVRVHQHRLVAVQLIWRNLQIVTEAVSQREIARSLPGVTEIDVVRRNDALRKDGTRDGQKLAGAAGIKHLRLRHEAKDRGVQRVPVRGLIRRHGGWDVSGRNRNPGPVVHLIDNGTDDVYAVIVALVLVEIALVLAAKLKEMVAVHQAEVVTYNIVLSVPESGKSVAAVNLHRDQSARAVRIGLDCSAEPGQLRGSAGA